MSLLFAVTFRCNGWRKSNTILDYISIFNTPSLGSSYFLQSNLKIEEKVQISTLSTMIFTKINGMSTISMVGARANRMYCRENSNVEKTWLQSHQPLLRFSNSDWACKGKRIVVRLLKLITDWYLGQSQLSIFKEL